MPNRNSKFTDHNLKLFYGNLLNHYKDSTKRFGSSDVEAVYRELFLATQYAVESPQGSLSHLPRWEKEKEKVYTAFHTIFYVLPLFTRLSPDKQRSFNPPRTFHHSLNNTSPPYIYNCSDPKLFDWIHLHDSIQPRSSYLKSPLLNLHERKNRHSSVLWAGLAIVSLAFSAAVITLAAWYYLFYQFVQGAERLWYNEGWMRMVLMSATALTSSALASTLTLICVTSPIVTVAFALNLNPLSMLIVAGICLSSVAASLGALSSNTLYDFIERRTHKRSIDAADPERFRLTEDEEDNLMEMQIDSTKVRCALVAIRVEMNRIQNSEESVPSFLNRHFGSQKQKDTHALLQLSRVLRQGKVSEACIGNLSFDCRFYQPLEQSQKVRLGLPGGLYPNLFSPEEAIYTASDVVPPQLQAMSLFP